MVPARDAAPASDARQELQFNDESRCGTVQGKGTGSDVNSKAFLKPQRSDGGTNCW